MANHSLYEKLSLFLWTLVVLVLFAIFTGGLATTPAQSLGVTSNCLLYAQAITNSSVSAYQQGFNLPGNNACQSGVVEGVVGIMTTVFLGVVSTIYMLWNTNQTIATAAAVMSSILTIYTVVITALANIGLYQTCANSTLCNVNSSNFQSNYHLVSLAVYCGWAAAILLFTHSMRAWFKVGLHLGESGKGPSSNGAATSSGARQSRWGNRRNSQMS